jgi:hypothetical protein
VSSPASHNRAPHSPAVARQRGRVGALTRSRASDDPDLIAARTELRTELLADYIARVVDEAPPLTAAQRERLVLVLRPQRQSGGAR